MRFQSRYFALVFIMTASSVAQPASMPEAIGTYEQCVAYPTPAGFRWSPRAIEAFCADTFTPTLSRSDIDKLIESGQGKVLDARYDKIVGDYLDGKLPEGAAFYAYATFNHGDDATAQLVGRWLEQSPQSPHALAARGIHHLRRGADARGSKFIRDTPQASLDLMEKELALARVDLTKAIHVDPRILYAYAALIDVARYTGGDRSLGPKTLARALKVDPKNFYVRAAFSFMCTPRWGGSIEYMDRVAAEAAPWIDANPRLSNLRAIAISHRGFEDFSAKRFQAALDQYERGLAEGPVGDNLFTAGFMAAKLGRDARAIELLTQALRFAPRDTILRQNRAASYVKIQKYDQAKADLDVILADVPDDGFALREYAFVLLDQKDYGTAWLKLEQARKSDPEDLWVAERLAWVYLYNKRSFKEAQPLIAQVLQKNPQNGAAWLMRADLIQNLGGPGLHEAAENFVRYADPSMEEQRNALPKVKAWLATHPKD
jgi:tetratricopeptide (TPR) repeat protein